MSKKNKVKRYTKIYRGHGKKRGTAFHVLVCLGLFILVAVVVYLVAMGINSYVNRQRCVEIELPESAYESAEADVKEPDSGKSLPQSTEKIVALEMSADRLSNSKYVTEFINKSKSEGKNAIVVPLKDENGTLLYSSKLARAKEWGAISRSAVDAGKIAAEIEAAGLIPIAKVNAFYDQTAPHFKRKNSYVYASQKVTYLFTNPVTKRSERWLNPYESSAREYICDIVNEVSNLGYKHVLLNHVSFPAVELNSKVSLDSGGKSKGEILRQFLGELNSLNVSYILGYDWRIFGEGNVADILYGGNISTYGAKNQAPLIDLNNRLNFSGGDGDVIKKFVDCVKNIGSDISIFPAFVSSSNDSKILNDLQSYGIYSSLILNK